MNETKSGDYQLILASQSPRRRELMDAAGYEFETVLPSEHAECGICTRETPHAMVARLALQKARDVAARGEFKGARSIVIGCDTVAECCGQILGKPHNREHAAEMLGLMSGREHRVVSGLCLWRCADDHANVDVDETRLRMAALSNDQIEDYLDTDLWIGKAGAFGYQDGWDWLQIVDGSESNVVGLPMELLAKMLVEI